MIFVFTKVVDKLPIGNQGPCWPGMHPPARAMEETDDIRGLQVIWSIYPPSLINPQPACPCMHCFSICFYSPNITHALHLLL